MRAVAGWSLVAVFCMTSVALAQVRTEERPKARPGAAPPAAAPGAAGQVRPGAGQAQQQGTPDQQIAALLHGCNQNEAALAKFAQQHAKSDSVKEFAAMMIKDHSQGAEKMARFAGNLAAANTARGDEQETRREVRREPAEDTPREARPKEERREPRGEGREERGQGREERGEARATAARGGQQPFSWVTIHKEVGEQCLKSTKEELGRYEGDNFDKAYMGQQIVAHMKALDELKVLKNYASTQLQQEIESAVETTEHHLQEARKIMDEQKDQGSEGTSGRKPSNRSTEDKPERRDR